MAKRSAHLLRIYVEGLSNYSAYKGGKISYVRDYDPTPMISLGLIEKMDIERAIKTLYGRKELSKQEVLMLAYVAADGRLSRRDISAMIKEDFNLSIDQRTVSRRLDSAYQKIAKFLGFEYADRRLFKMVAKMKNYPPPYILSDEEIDIVQTICERV